MEELKNIFNNTQEQVTLTTEMRDEIRVLTDIVDQFKSMATKYQESIKDTIVETNSAIKEMYNANWFVYTETDKNLKSINKSIDNFNNSKFVDQLRSDKGEPDYLEEQREESKLYQSKLTNTLLKDMLKEIRKGRVGNRVVSNGDQKSGGILGGITDGLMSMLGLGGLGLATKKGYDVTKAGKSTKTLTKLKNLKRLAKGGKLALAGSTAGATLGGSLALFAVDEYFGISDGLIDTVHELYTGVKVNKEEKTISDKLIESGRKIQDLRHNIPDFIRNAHPAMGLADDVWDWIDEVTKYEKEKGNDENSDDLLGKLGKLGGFFTENNPMDLMKQLYTDEDKFKKSLNEFTGIVVGNQLDTVDETKKEAEGKQKEREQQIVSKKENIQSQPNLDTQYRAGEDELKPTEEIDRQLAKYLLDRDERVKKAEEQNESGKTFEVPNRYNLNDEINNAAMEFGIDPNLWKAVVQAESNFDPNARSNKGAVGLSQMTEIAAKDVGADWERVQTDPQYNLRQGANYFSKMMRQFNGNTELALSAYNAGPTATRRAGGVANNAETQAYVSKVLGNKEVYDTREQQVKARREQERTTQLRNTSIAENNQPADETPNQIWINAPNNTSVQNEDDRLTRINSSSPFDLTYAKLLFNPNYNVV